MKARHLMTLPLRPIRSKAVEDTPEKCPVCGSHYVGANARPIRRVEFTAHYVVVQYPCGAAFRSKRVNPKFRQHYPCGRPSLRAITFRVMEEAQRIEKARAKKSANAIPGADVHLAAIRRSVDALAVAIDQLTEAGI